MMPWVAWALMAMTFGIDLLPVAPQPGGVSLDQSVTEPTFRDVCTKSGKWFRPLQICFVGPSATKHSGQKSVQFQCTENTVLTNWTGRNEFLGLAFRRATSLWCRRLACPGRQRSGEARLRLLARGRE